MFTLNGKKAIITGGSSGIGMAIATTFARQGAAVTVFDLNTEGSDALKSALREEGIEVNCVPVNVAEFSEVEKAIESCDGVDILVNCAGIAHVGKAHNTSEEDFNRVLRVNVNGVFNCTKAVLPQMMERKSGVILNLASIAAWVGLPDRFVYSATKGAVYAMTLSVAKDYLEYSIRCNSISPARVHTPFVDGFIAKNYPGKEAEMFEKLSRTQPIGRMAKPDEVAALALYLCSDEAGFITGCDYPIDGGFIKLNN